MLTYLEIARRLRPRWVVWENVPGVLSSNGGRDFGSFLGALGELGYGWAYRVLDAQWVRTQRHPRAVPQRRRRVFVVGCLGDWTAPAEILFERESVQRDSAPRRAKGQGAAADAADGARAGQWWDGSDCAATLTKQNANGAQRMPDKDNLGAVLTLFRAGSISGYTEGDAAGTLRAGGGGRAANLAAMQPVPFRKSKRAQVPMATIDMQACKGSANIGDGTVSPTLCAPSGNDVHAVAYGTDMYNHAITGDVVATMTKASGSACATGPTVMQAIGFNWQNAGGYGNANEGLGITVEGTGPLQRCQTPAVAFSCKDHGADAGTVAPTLRAMPHDGSHANGGGQIAVAHALRGEGFDASEDGTGRGTPIIPVAPSLTASNDPSRSPQSAEVTQQVAAVHAATMALRRLTPRECERLQAFPDDYTLIPWRKKPADQCPDGPRYKALGNSMAVNCMEWIGQRIDAWEQGQRHA